MQTTLRPTTILRIFAPEYIEKNSGNTNISNELYAATIAAPALPTSQGNTKDYIGIIGSEAFKLFFQAEAIWKDQNLFCKDSTNAESKALYLVKLHVLLHTVSQELKEEYSASQQIDPFNIKKGEFLLDHIDTLNLKAGNTALESGVMLKYHDIVPVLKKAERTQEQTRLRTY